MIFNVAVNIGFNTIPNAGPTMISNVSFYMAASVLFWCQGPTDPEGGARRDLGN